MKTRQLCHIEVESGGVAFCGVKKGAGRVWGGLATADCMTCLRLAIDAGDLDTLTPEEPWHSQVLGRLKTLGFLVEFDSPETEATLP